MLVRGQVPPSWSGEMPDVLAMLRSGYAPDDGGSDGGSGDGQDSGGAGAGGSGGGGSGDDDAYDKDRALATIRRLRENEKAAKQTAKELEEARARLAEIENKDKSDGEKAVAALRTTEAKLKAAELEAESLRKRYTDSLIANAIEREATKANAVDAETVAALVDRSAIDIDDDGNVKGAEAAVKALLKAKPFLVAGEKAGVKTTPGTPNGADTTASRAEIVKRETEQLRAHYGSI